MSLIPLGTGVVGIDKIYHELVRIGFDGYSTLEVAGERAVRGSFEYLKKLEMP
ncbi:sugar phosphate isomerase/epimerase [Parapedobacter soli]|uniref:sugar phosphate isomerase/epimerase n=1 Tax=Parapedobacter soli TaxID=416955 RepID=UPI0021C7BA53|nr:sugar phosphate isomerase/epimerase [Parapedobacter soli]